MTLEYADNTGSAQRANGVTDSPTPQPEPPRRASLIRRLVIAATGGTVVAIGIAMIVLPGPAVVVIPAGLAILATEFLWARRMLRRGKGAVMHARGKLVWPAFLRRKPRPGSAAEKPAAAREEPHGPRY